MFYRQIDNHDCQPAALANALTWAGQRVNYWADARAFMDLCGCSKEGGGSSYWGFNSLLYRVGRGLFSVTTVENPRLEEITEHLQAGGAVILSYIFFFRDTGKVARHTVFFPGMTESGNYLVVGAQETSEVVAEVNPQTMEDRLLYFKVASNPTTAYLLQRS